MPPPRLLCPRCQADQPLDEALRGRTVRCPECAALLRVPAAPASEAATLPPAPPADDPAGRTQAYCEELAEATDNGAEAIDPAGVPGYEILGELGRGGMGVVYKARQVKLNRLVALKMILAGGHAGPADLARFRAEAEAVARLQHPNVVQVHDTGEHQGRLYLALEYCPGGSLEKRLGGTPWTPRRAAGLVETLARAMHAAHQRQIIHRDLKPANVLLAEDGTPKVTDFGLAKRLDEAGQTQTGAILGTPSYMAPEQAGGRPQAVGPAADVYALGAVLYELLTGRPPFKAPTALDTVLQVVSEEPVPPTRLQRAVPRDLETVCLKCLHKEPRKRYASALALADDLRAFREGKPVRARPVGRLSRGWRWCRRNPVVAGLLAAVVLSLLAGIGASSYFAVQARRRARDADASAEQARAEKLVSDRRLYVGDMRLAQRAWEDGQVGRVLELLEGQRPEHTGGRDLRGFEYYYWWRRCHSDLLTLPGEPSSLRLVAFGRDGRELLTIREAGRGASRGPGLPTTLSEDVEVRDPATGREIRTTRVEMGPHYGMALSPDRKYLAVATIADTRVRVYDLATGRETLRLPNRVHAVEDVAFSPDGRRLAFGGGNYPVPALQRPGTVVLKVCDVQTGREVFSLPGHTGPVHRVAYSPDGRLLASTSQDGTVKLWDARAGKEVRTLRRRWACREIVFSPDGRLLACVSAEGRGTALLDVGSGKEVRTLPAGPGPVAFSPDGKHLAGAATPPDYPTRVPTGEVAVWELATGRIVRRYRGHTRPLRGLAFSPDGRRVASASHDGALKLWDFPAGPSTPPLDGFTPAFAGAAASPDRRLLAGVQGSEIKVWESATGRLAWSLRRHFSPVNSVAFSADGGRIASAAGGSVSQGRILEGQVKLWDGASGRQLLTLAPNSPRNGYYTRVALSPDGRLLAALLGTMIQVWDAATGRELFSHRTDAWMTGLAFSADGRLLAGSTTAEVRVWDTGTGQLTRTLRGSLGALPALAFSPDGRLLAGSAEQDVRVWDVATGQRVCVLKGGHTHLVRHVAFSPDGKRIATAAGDTVTLWDADSGQEILSLHEDRATIIDLAFSPDGRRLSAVTAGLAVHVYDATPTDEAAAKPG